MGGYWPAHNEAPGTEEWQDTVATPADLPTTAQTNEIRGVADDGDGKSAVYRYDGAGWDKIADEDLGAAAVVDLQIAYTGSATPAPIVCTAGKDLAFRGSTSGSWTWTAETMALTQVGAGLVTITGNLDATNGLDVSVAALTASAGLDVSAGTIDLGSVTPAASTWAATTLAITGSTSAKFGDGVGTIDFDGSGNMADTGVASYVFTPTGIYSVIAGGAVSFNSTGGTFNIASNANNYNVNLGTAGTRQVALGSTTSSSTTLVRSGTGGIHLDSSGAFSVDAAAASNITTTVGNLLVQATAGTVGLTGGHSKSTVSKSAAYVLTISDYCVEAQTGAGAYDLTLPALATVLAGQEFQAVRCGTNLIRLVGDGAELISGLNAQPLNAQWDSITVRANAAKTYWMKV